MTIFQRRNGLLVRLGQRQQSFFVGLFERKHFIVVNLFQGIYFILSGSLLSIYRKHMFRLQGGHELFRLIDCFPIFETI